MDTINRLNQLIMATKLDKKDEDLVRKVLGEMIAKKLLMAMTSKMSDEEKKNLANKIKLVNNDPKGLFDYIQNICGENIKVKESIDEYIQKDLSVFISKLTNTLQMK